MNLEEVVDRLKAIGNPKVAELKANKFNITSENSLGIYQKDIKSLAKDIGLNNDLALELFDSGIYEAKLLCCRIFKSGCLTKALMHKFVLEFDNWEICDSFSMGFFSNSAHALEMAFEWSKNEKEFIKRSAFCIMASYGFANKNAENAIFESFLPIIEREASDERLYVKKAVNWALRNIGKRNKDLNRKSIKTANNILKQGSKPALWIAKDALRELQKPNLKLQDYPRNIYRK